MEPYKLPLRAAEAEFTEKKSRFISSISPVSSEEEALIFMSLIRNKHSEATHNVYAYRIKTTGVYRRSDDGEPSGTAGTPLLEVFMKRDIYDFCCVATRYFGGILLGAGGLVRAYARCGAIALEASGVGIMREMLLCAIKLPYSLYESAKRLLSIHSAGIDTEDFGAQVDIRFLVNEENFAALSDNFQELTSGTVTIHKEGHRKSLVTTGEKDEYYTSDSIIKDDIANDRKEIGD